MMHRGVATFTLDSGTCPRWLFERMVKLGREMVLAIVSETGPGEFVRRLGDPVWFQSLGTVLAFDWNASGLTTILTAALKEAVRGREKSMGVFICGGKGKTSRKTPDEIRDWGSRLALPPGKVENLVYNSRMAAKVDSALVQDGFQIYHHSFFFSPEGSWTVVQQGMNTRNQTARRYHWHSEKITDLVCEPHSGIASVTRAPTLNLTAKESAATRSMSTDLARGSYHSLIRDINIIRRHSSPLSDMASVSSGGETMTALTLRNVEFKNHPVTNEDFSKSAYLEKILSKVCDVKPARYEDLLSMEGVGPKTMRALSLVSEVIYGARPSYEDPARYSFAHGGKDGTPFPVDRETYDATIHFFSSVIRRARLPAAEKNRMLGRLAPGKERNA